jgi:hypothetical protein
MILPHRVVGVGIVEGLEMRRLLASAPVPASRVANVQKKYKQAKKKKIDESFISAILNIC